MYNEFLEINVMISFAKLNKCKANYGNFTMMRYLMDMVDQ